jgi:hypothetical protein
MPPEELASDEKQTLAEHLLVHGLHVCSHALQELVDMPPEELASDKQQTLA